MRSIVARVVNNMETERCARLSKQGGCVSRDREWLG